MLVMNSGRVIKSRRPVCWIVKRESDSAMLGTNGKWYLAVAGIEHIKTYRTSTNAIKHGLKGQQGTAFALYEGDTIDRNGIIERNTNQ